MIEDKFVELNNVRIHFIEGPAFGQPILFLHGLTDSVDSYMFLMTNLLESYHVYVLDLRGHGLTMHVPNAYRIKDYAQDVQNFLLNTFSEPVVLVGHSLGALVSVWVAVRNCKLVKGLFLEDPPLYKDSIKDFRNTISYRVFLFILRELRKHKVAGSLVEDLEKRIANWPAPLSFGNEKKMIDVVDRQVIRLRAVQLDRLDLETLVALIDGQIFNGFNSGLLLSKILCPVHMVVGQYKLGGVIEERDVKRAIETIPKASFSIVEGIGHFIHQLRPKEYLLELEKFLRSLI
jgi:pimeloyl-ACP methyl ester carboxylesterase